MHAVGQSARYARTLPLMRGLRMKNELGKLIELLSIVAEENLGCDVAEGLSEKIAWDEIPEISGVYGNLFHYWHDQDIRKKDKEYNFMKDTELNKLIRHLKNKEFAKANNISFLGAIPNS
jgi:hypothetical protein